VVAMVMKACACGFCSTRQRACLGDPHLVTATNTAVPLSHPHANSHDGCASAMNDTIAVLLVEHEWLVWTAATAFVLPSPRPSTHPAPPSHAKSPACLLPVAAPPAAARRGCSTPEHPPAAVSIPNGVWLCRQTHNPYLMEVEDDVQFAHLTHASQRGQPPQPEAMHGEVQPHRSKADVHYQSTDPEPPQSGG